MKTIKAYKGFDANWKCRDFQYEVGKTYTEDKAKLCSHGFHACEYPLDIFSYYDPTGQMAEVELAGVTQETDGDDSKRCGTKINIKAALTIPALVQASIAYVTERCDLVKAAHSMGYRSASSATGYSSASSATGYSSASSATGYSSASSATGDRSASLTTGNYSSSEVLKADSQSVAIGAGYQNKARAANGCAIVLCERDDEYRILHIRASKVGDNGIKPDVWYSLKDGEFVAVE